MAGNRSQSYAQELDGRIDDFFGKKRRRWPFDALKIALLQSRMQPHSQKIWLPKEDHEWAIASIGGMMEDIAKLLTLTAAEVQESKAALQAAMNDIRAVHNVLAPELINQITALRTNRFAAVSETRAILSALGDVRDFFLGENYEQEMTKIERFVRLCRDLSELKATGVLDAVCESAIRLSDGRPPDGSAGL